MADFTVNSGLYENSPNYFLPGLSRCGKPILILQIQNTIEFILYFDK